MNNIGININTQKDPDKSVLNRILNKIEERECNVFVFNDCQEMKEKCMKLDMIIALGGDGTILRTARIVSEYGVPILGINFGNLGFLTTAENTELEHILEEVLEGRYYIEQRMMLECSLKDKHKQKKIVSLNDIVICKGTLSRVVNYEVIIDGNYYNDLVADGIIISTPTGSTAYSLSAGGPIVYPNLDLIAITPICPLSLSMRSIILDSKSIIVVKTCKTNESVFLTVDGQEAFELNDNTEIAIKKSEYKCKLIKVKEYDYFKTLRKKIISRIKE